LLWNSKKYYLKEMNRSFCCGSLIEHGAIEEQIEQIRIKMHEVKKTGDVVQMTIIVDVLINNPGKVIKILSKKA